MGGRTYTYQRDSFATPFIDIVRWTCLLLPLPLSVYTAFAANGVVAVSPLFSPGAAWGFTFLFFLVAAWNFLSHDLNVVGLAFRQSALQVTFAAYLIVVSGFASPLVFSWMLLVVAIDVFFGLAGIIASLSFFVACATTALAWTNYSYDLKISAIATVIYSVIGAVFAVLIRSATRREHSELAKAKRLSQSDHSQLVTILNSMSVGIASVDTQGNIRLYNAALIGLIDTNDNLKNKPLDSCMPVVTCDGETVSFMSLAEKTFMTQRDDLKFTYPDGDEIRLSIVVNPIIGRHNRPTGYIFIIEDITKEKNLDEERDEFISVISHELRTPITIAEGSISNAQLLLDRGADASMYKKMFATAHEQVVFLANMVNDLGTLSRAERGVGDAVEPIDIDELAQTLYNKYNDSAKQKGLRFDLDIAGRVGTVSTSRLYLEEILQNFITNAIKYTQKGSVTLRIRKTREGVHFAVKDSGIGISKADQKRIFEKFYRSEDYRTRESSGTGLGLYVVQKLSHKLSTTIEVSSQLNHGSEFSFTLPRK